MTLQLNSPPFTRFGSYLLAFSRQERQTLQNYHSFWPSLISYLVGRPSTLFTGYLVGERAAAANFQVPGVLVLLDLYDDPVWLPQTMFNRFHVSGDRITEQLEHGTCITDNSTTINVTVTRRLLNLGIGDPARVSYARNLRRDNLANGRLRRTDADTAAPPPPPVIFASRAPEPVDEMDLDEDEDGDEDELDDGPELARVAATASTMSQYFSAPVSATTRDSDIWYQNAVNQILNQP
jgi:hypothetical protein